MSEPPQSSSSAASFKKRQEDALKKQTGELPPDLDQDGKMINPHNPDFITKVPWYLGDSGPTLKHHSVQKEEHVLSMTETDELVAEKYRAQQEIKQAGSRVGVFKKGACKNCGSMSHKEKDCVERPRSKAKSAWKTGVGMAPTTSDVRLELTKFGKVSFDGKRDQWAGYDPAEHRETVDRYERLETERKAKEKEERRLAKERAEAEEEARVLAMAEEAAAADEESTVNIAAGGGRGKSRAEASGARRQSRPGGENPDGHSSGTADSDSDTDTDSDSDDSSEESGSESEARQSKREFRARDEQAKDFQSRQARQGGVGGAQMKITVRNLRLREDTPKYLRNLALESAHYDPKSRSMRANPNPNENPETSVYAGDNFVRYSGDALELAKTQVLCWDLEQQASGKAVGGEGEEADNQISVDLLSNPSQAELAMRTYAGKKTELEKRQREEILKKYGSSSSSGSGIAESEGGKVNTVIRDEEEERDGSGLTGARSVNRSSAAVTATLADPRLRLGQTETFQQYSSDGRAIKGPSAGPAKPGRTVSKYEEDVFTNNHTSVWGSFYSRRTQKWGYACCHSLIHNSYCTGSVGREANDAQQSGVMDINAAKKMVDFHAKEKEKQGQVSEVGSAGYHPNSTKSSSHFSKSDLDGKNVVLDKDKLAAALGREDAQRSARSTASGDAISVDDRKRGYNQSASGDGDAGDEVTAESLEAYRLKRTKTDDPMAALMDSDVLLDYK